MNIPEPPSPETSRIIVIGCTACGKTTFAASLADHLQVSHIEIDALYWLPGWKHVTEGELRSRINALMRSNGWVLDGNYSKVRDISWGQAQAIVWLDYPFLTIFWRLLIRTLRRTLSHETLWGTNVESFWNQFKFWSGDSLFSWQIKSYRQHKRQYPALFARPEYAHLKVYHFLHPFQAEAWLKSL
jgi:adenylate kinase family enzyme